MDNQNKRKMPQSVSNGGAKKSKSVMQENLRVSWTNEAIKCYLETCIEEINKVGRNRGSLRKETWAKLAEKLDEVCHIKPMQKQLKNLYDYLKRKYSIWVYIKNRTGNSYDSETNTFKLSDQEWEDISKDHPKAKTLRTSPLPFPELCIALFEGTTAIGSRVYAPSPIREMPVVSSSSSSSPSHIQTTQNEEKENDDNDDHDHDDDDEEKEEEEGHANVERIQEPNVDKASANPSNVEGPNVTSSRPKKKSKTSINWNEFAKELVDMLRILVAPPPPPLPPPPPPPPPTSILGACIDRLNTLGLDPRDPLHCAAIDLFGHSTLLRDTWLMMPPDHEVLTDWITRTARRLGFME